MVAEATVAEEEVVNRLRAGANAVADHAALIEMCNSEPGGFGVSLWQRAN
jgi:hypothetical protein